MFSQPLIILRVFGDLRDVTNSRNYIKVKRGIGIFGLKSAIIIITTYVSFAQLGPVV
jgi:hypothetical protein